MSDLHPRHIVRNLRARLRVSSSGPRSRLRVITLNHPLLDPGIAYWVVDESLGPADSGRWGDD